MRYLNKTYLSVILILLVINCALDYKIPDLPHHYSMNDMENSIIIGHVSYNALYDKNSNRTKDIFGFHINKIITIKNISSGEVLYFDSNQEENSPYFVVLLPPGKYVITRISMGNRYLKPFVKLVVDKGKIIYIGHLIFNETHINKKQLFQSMILHGGNFGINGKWTIEDNYLQAKIHFKHNYTNIDHEVTKSIVTSATTNLENN